jgi:hypothetical protein
VNSQGDDQANPQSATPERPEEPTGNIPPTDPVYSDEQPSRIQTGLLMRQELQSSSDRLVYKRLRTPEPDPGAGGSQWMAKCEGRGAPDSPDTRCTKRRKIMAEEETGDRAAAQRGETQELRVRRTPEESNDISKLGRGLEESLSVPSQGLYHQIPLRPTVTGATLSLPNLEDQAWKNGEGADHEEETDGERCARLMYCEGGSWRCRECNGRAFADRSTLRRHCKSVHGTHKETLKCPYLHCTKEYKRQSGLNRHVREKHGGAEGHGGSSSSILY